jgi:hypothetical protein
MNPVIAMLFVFVALGLAGQRLGKRTYVALGLVILAYVVYAYRTG